MKESILCENFLLFFTDIQGEVLELKSPKWIGKIDHVSS